MSNDTSTPAAEGGARAAQAPGAGAATWFSRALVVTAAACLVGLGLGLLDASRHGLLARGFWRSLLIALAAPLPAAAAIGAVCGLLLAALLWADGRRERVPLLDGNATWRVSAGVLVVSLMAGLLPRGGGQATLAVANPFDVVLIVVDTLRADAVPEALQPARAAAAPGPAPNLARLAHAGVRFSAATAQAPWTMPSVGSVMTGLYPTRHAAIALSGRLPERALTLAEILREAGYRTAGVVSHFYVDRAHGFAQGFDRFDESQVRGHRAVTSHEVTRLARAELERPGEQPLFLFAHYFDPHYLYHDYDQLHDADAYDGWLREHGGSIRMLRDQRHRLDDADRAWLRDLYREEVRNTDGHIGLLLRAVAARQRPTAVIVVADHGEEFFERGWLGHTITLHEEVVHVPLLMRLPGVEPGLVSQPVETRRVFATLLDYLGLRGAARFADADDSLLAPANGKRAGERRHADAGAPRPVFSASQLRDADLVSGRRVELHSVRDGRWKLIHDVLRGRAALYDLERDPLEQHDLAAAEPARVARLQALLARHRESQARGAPPSPRLELDADERQRLRSLGYY